MNGITEQRLYLQRITKSELGPQAMISRAALGVLDSLLAEAATLLTVKASAFVSAGDVVTMQGRHVEAAVRMVSDGDLSREMLASMAQALASYSRNRKDREGPPSSKSQAAGLILATARVDTAIRSKMLCKNLGEAGTVTMTAALEAVVRRIVRAAQAAAIADRKRKKITPHYIMLAIQADPDLQILFKTVRIAGAGVVPKRKRRVAKKTKKKKRKKQKVE